MPLTTAPRGHPAEERYLAEGKPWPESLALCGAGLAVPGWLRRRKAA